MRHPFFDLPKPRVVGHRGASGERPENTLPSFALALEQGAVVIETDVHRTSDGHVVISHDPDVSRMTDGAGELVDFTHAALRELDAGYRFSPDGGHSHPFRGQGIAIPTLDEVFETFPGVRFNIEVKQNDPQLIDGTLACVRRHGREKWTLLAAAEDDTMAALRSRLAESGLAVAMGAAVGDVVGFVRALIEGRPPPPEPMALQVPPDFGGDPLVTPELVRFAHDHDVEVHVWTVNDAQEMHRLLDLGVDALMSDFPGRLSEVVASRGGPS